MRARIENYDKIQRIRTESVRPFDAWASTAHCLPEGHAEARTLSLNPTHLRHLMLPKVFCYTIALDLNEVKFYRQQARMMVASLKRCGFRGDIKIIHNGGTKIFDSFSKGRGTTSSEDSSAVLIEIPKL